MSRISVKAVLIGSFVDIAGSFLIGCVFFVAAIVIFVAAHVPRGTLHQHGIFTGLMFVIGVSISALGGYIAARIAKHDEFLNAGLSTFPCILLSLLELAKGREGALVSLLVAPAAAILGGYLAMQQTSRATTA